MRPAVLGLAKTVFLGLFQLSSVAAAPVSTFLGITKDEDAPKDAEDPSLWLYLAIAAILVLLGGAFAGLTIALMGQDGVYLQVIATSGEGKEQRHAQRVFRLLKKGKHWVLVTLLLSNVIVNETLPIVLDRSLGGGWPAVLGSTALIVIFGEVIPQSICVRYGLSIGAYMAPFVLALMWLLAPFAWPTAKLLDKLLGEDHGTVYKKSGLKTLVTLHKTLGTSPGDRLNQDEVTIISAVLDLKDKAVGDIMTPMEDVFTMSADTVLDEDTMNIILTAGYSRIPIYEPGNEQNFLGMLLVKILITYDPEDCKRVGEFALATLPETRPETSCLDIVNFFQEGKSHMALVSEYPGESHGATGVVTLEDVIEELIGEEIIDESDVYIDVHKAIRRMAPAPKSRVPKGHIAGATDKPIIQAPEDLLINLAEENPITPEISAKSPNGDSRSNSPAITSFGTSPKTTFLRRTPNGSDGNHVAVRGNVNDMREHLKHLGPSNLASRPKSTRYNTVKIKPGQIPSRSNCRTDSSFLHDPIAEEHAPQGGEGEGLLKSAGKDAKDGVQAIQQGYGATSFQPSSPGRLGRESLLEVHRDTPKDGQIIGERSRSPTPPSNARYQTHHSDRSSDTVDSIKSQNSSPTRRKRGAARSGSITQNIIDSGGVQKMILQTSSSIDDVDSTSFSKDRRPGGNTSPRFLSNDGTTDNNSGSKNRENVPPQKSGEEVSDVKKPKRRRKRKGGKSADDGFVASSAI
ncbi:hypothetical protein B7494_g4607 [Chlorociboria aeruginascens]|nr:hypothetical protein B7494_g4607 [Chlorociboria aeruginascens]